MCDCVTDLNARLKAEHNGILITTLFGSPTRCTVGVDKLDTKVRKRPPVVIASFCPFCGEAYAKASVGQQAETA